MKAAAATMAPAAEDADKQAKLAKLTAKFKRAVGACLYPPLAG